MAKRWLPALRGALTGVETKGLAERVRSQSTNYTVTGTPYAETWNVDRAVREGFKANPWIFRAVEVIAYTAISRKIVLRQGDPDEGREIPISADHSRMLYRLNRSANKWESAKIFRYRLIAQFLLSSKGVYIEVTRNQWGGIAMLTLLDPDLVEKIPSRHDPIGAFEIRTTGDTGGRRDFLPPFDPAADDQANSVLWIRSPHPTILTTGMSPMEAAGLSVDLDRYARLYNRDYMQAGGRPGGILGVRGSVGPETVLALEQHFNHNARPGETTAIAADALYYQDLSTSPRDVQWGEIMDRMKAEAAMVFGVPESMMGDASGRCVTPDTEALTARGWVTGDQLTTDDTILTLDPADGRMKWSPVLEVYRKADYSGPLYTLGNIGATVTTGHKWVIEPRTRAHRAAAGDDLHTKVTVEQLGTHDRIVTMGDAEAGAPEATYSDAFVELVGWAVTEGHFTPNDTSRASRPDRTAPYVRIRQNVGPNADRIVACAKESGARLHTYERDGRLLVNVRGEIAAALHQVAPGKVMTPEFLLALTAGQRQLLMTTMLDADGCTSVPNTASWTFAQKDRRAAEAFVFLATLCGYTTSIRERTFTYRHNGVERPASDWMVIVRQRKRASIQHAEGRTVEHYDGPVWCPRTAYGTFVARRDGKVFVTSNTFDNADAEYAIFLEHRLAPLLALIDDQLDALTGEDTDDLWLRHDLSDVWVLKRHRRADEDRAAADLERGALTMNEYREFLGLSRIEAPWANVHWIMPSKAAGYVDDPADAAAAAAAPLLGQGAPPGAGPGGGGMGGGMGAGAGGGADPAATQAEASYNAQTNANAALRLVAADGQGRNAGGGNGGLPQAGQPPELELAHGRPDELEGKQSRGRARAASPTWR